MSRSQNDSTFVDTYFLRYHWKTDCSFTFDLVPGKSPLILGMDVRAYCDTYNLGDQKYIKLKRPTDSATRVLFTYLVPDNNRLRLVIAPHPRSVVRTLLGNVHASFKRTPLIYCKRIHRYTHSTKEEMKRLCLDAKIDDGKLEEIIGRVVDACEICAKNGRPKSSRKISLTHVNQGFNQEIQIDFFFFEIQATKRTIMHITDTGTTYSGLAITSDRSMRTIIRTLEEAWLRQHGAPQFLSANDEYNRSPLRSYLTAHHVIFKPRPARRHKKLGIVSERTVSLRLF